MKIKRGDYKGIRRVTLELTVPANKYQRKNKQPDYNCIEGAVWKTCRNGVDGLYVNVHLTEESLRQACRELGIDGDAHDLK